MPLPNRSFRELMASRPAEGRVFYHNIWFKGHNNPRYAALLPRLSRLDLYVVTCSDQRIVRGLQFRGLRATRRARNRLVFGAARRRYHYLFSSDLEQIPYFAGPVVVDVDDPRFTAGEVELLARPNVMAYVLTAESAGRRFQELGLHKPYHVIPQGVSLDRLDPTRVDQIGGQVERPGELVVGYVAAWLLSRRDRDGDNPLYNVDHLLELWDEVGARLPQARLWLVGQPSEQVRALCRDRPNVRLLGRLSQADALAHVANFDIAVYPRKVDHVPFPVKMAEYMGLGIPTVAYRLELSKLLADTGSGLTADSAHQFVEAVVRLGGDDELRRRMSEAARAAGSAFHMDTLARRYEREVLDRYLP